jgi:predicted negative regulator of RcsB-dependent stress response
MMCLLCSGVFGALVDDPMFKYRCAERAFRLEDYALAKKFYGEIDPDSPELKLIAICGVLDSMLCLGQWISAEHYVELLDFKQLEGVDGYDDLILRVCFVLIKNRHFASVKSILARINSAALQSDILAWYHLLNAMVLCDERQFEVAQSEFELARECAQSDKQARTVELFNLQEIVASPRLDTDSNSLENLLRERVSPPGRTSADWSDFLNLYALFESGIGKRTEALRVLEEFSQFLDQQEDICMAKIYHAVAAGILSDVGLADMRYVLIGDCNLRTKLLAIKLLVGAARGARESATVVDLLDSVFEDAGEDFVRRSIFLAKIAIFLNIERLDACSKAASAYINLFSRDKFFEDICELLAYVALGGESLEYRNSARYLDKLRVSMVANGERLAITMKIADAFFYNSDFKLASDMYGEALRLDSVGKCGHALANQIISDIALGDYDRALAHIEVAGGDVGEKFDAIIEYISALRRDGMCDEALRYLDSLNLANASKLVRCKLAIHRAEILLKKKQYSQAFVLSANVYDTLIAQFNLKQYSKICGQALFINGWAACKLKDAKMAGEAFKLLRTSFQDTEYCALSFFKEAKLLRDMGDMHGAIAALELCKDRKYARLAGYKIALLKFQSGHLGESIALLEGIVRDDPDDKIAAAARVTQGDILRAAGDFGNAQLIYECAGDAVASVGDWNYLQLARARCLVAQKNRDARYLAEAESVLKNLYFGANLDAAFRLECAAEYCLVLKLEHEFDRLKIFAFDLLASIDGSDIQLTGRSRYWLVQILFILRDSAGHFQSDSGYIDAMIDRYDDNSDD